MIQVAATTPPERTVTFIARESPSVLSATMMHPAAGRPVHRSRSWHNLLSPRPATAHRADEEHRPMKLVTAIVHNEDAGTLVDALLEREFRATRLHSSGGFLKQGNATILVGVEDDQVDAVLELISANCHSRRQFVNPMPPIMEPGEFYMPYPVEVEVGGATVFVLPVERFERL
jgi:uncharacterized protein YaaQ